MSLDLGELRVRAPRYPEETPYWPCALFLHDDEIVAAVFFDDAEVGGYPVDAHGVVQRDAEMAATGEVVGWCLHILSETSPSPVDPRFSAPDIDVWGAELSLPEVMEKAYEAVQARARPGGVSYEESRNRLLWKPTGGW